MNLDEYLFLLIKVIIYLYCNRLYFVYVSEIQNKQFIFVGSFFNLINSFYS